ncbi:outer membrane beta-barrel protein [Porphyromonas macacae]
MLSGQLSMRPAPWVSMLYEISYGLNSSRAIEEKNYERRDNYIQKLNLVFTPDEQWRIELTGNHYYNEIAKNIRKHYLLTDASVVFSALSSWELNLTGRNLFNNRIYSYTSLSELMNYSAMYQIRPLEVLVGVFFRF